ncbi:MAG TPA: hypothetical protein VF184_05575, partial [Phycisphaeraceae bacterium]
RRASKIMRLNRLIEEQLDASDNSLDYTTGFDYDGAGNRLEQLKDLGGDGSVEQTTTYVYDANDRLLSETFDAAGTAEDRHTVYSYDADGDGVNEATVQTGKAVYAGLDDTGTLESRTSYTFDERGRLSLVRSTNRLGG